MHKTSETIRPNRIKDTEIMFLDQIVPQIPNVGNSTSAVDLGFSTGEMQNPLFFGHILSTAATVHCEKGLRKQVVFTESFFELCR